MFRNQPDDDPMESKHVAQLIIFIKLCLMVIRPRLLFWKILSALLYLILNLEIQVVVRKHIILSYTSLFSHVIFDPEPGCSRSNKETYHPVLYSIVQLCYI
jgi:hypothetical protein